MNEEQYYNKEIKSICDNCGSQDGEHYCECGVIISSSECYNNVGYCDECIIKRFNNQ